MQNFLKIADGINVQPLLLALYRQPGIFTSHSFRQTVPGSPHAAAEDILLRCQPMDGSCADSRESVWYEASHGLPEARRLVMALMGMVEGERLGRVMITRLTYPHTIRPHSDVGDHPLQYERVRYWGRYHIALQTDPAALFWCADEVVHMAAGECWYFRNDLEHEVFWADPGERVPQQRIHLIVDIHSANEDQGLVVDIPEAFAQGVMP